jgi:hypothetical protein
VGPTLQFDPVTERFVGEFAKEANQIQEGHYRQEFQLPVLS